MDDNICSEGRYILSPTTICTEPQYVPSQTYTSIYDNEYEYIVAHCATKLCHPMESKEKAQPNAIAGVFYCISMFIGLNCVGRKALNNVMRGVGKTRCLFKFVIPIIIIQIHLYKDSKSFSVRK